MNPRKHSDKARTAERIVGWLALEGVGSHKFVCEQVILARASGRLQPHDISRGRKSCEHAVRMGTRAWYRRNLVVHLDAFDRVVSQVLEHSRHIGFRDMARAEYETMLYLVRRGWRNWFLARGLDSDLSDLAIPDMSSRMDVALDWKMHAVGVYTKGGVLGTKANAVNYYPTLSRMTADL